MSKPAIDHRDRLEALNGKLSNLGMRGYWQLRHDGERMEPKLWRWADIYPALMETADVVRIGADAFRRNVGLQTGSRTISMGFQIVLPGEAAPPHRHTNTALRFLSKEEEPTRPPMAYPRRRIPANPAHPAELGMARPCQSFKGADHLDRRA